MAPDASGEPTLVAPHHAAAFVRAGLLQHRQFRRVAPLPKTQPGPASGRPPDPAGGGRGQIGTPQKEPGEEKPEAEPPDLPDLLPSEEEFEKLDWGLGSRGSYTGAEASSRGPTGRISGRASSEHV